MSMRPRVMRQPRCTGRLTVTASRSGAAAVVTLLLSSGADVNHRMPEHEQTALMWAASEKHPEVIRALIGGGADINAKSKTAYTPLMFAARSGDPEATRLLVDAGADVNAAAMDGFTPLLLATVRGHVGPATFLLEHGADPNAAGPGYTALHWSAGSWWTRLTGLGGIQAESHPEWRA